RSKLVDPLSSTEYGFVTRSILPIYLPFTKCWVVMQGSARFGKLQPITFPEESCSRSPKVCRRRTHRIPVPDNRRRPVKKMKTGSVEAAEAASPATRKMSPADAADVVRRPGKIGQSRPVRGSSQDKGRGAFRKSGMPRVEDTGANRP